MNSTRHGCTAALVLLSLAGPRLAAGGEADGAFTAAYAAFDQARRGDEKAAERACELFQKLSDLEPANPLPIAYAGASWTLRGKAAWTPWNKMKLTERGLDQIDRALALLAPAHDEALVRGVPVSVETRLVAASTFLALPDLFHRFELGKSVLADALASPALARSPAVIRAQLQLQAAGVARKEKRKEAEVEALRNVLALAGSGPLADQARARLAEVAP